MCERDIALILLPLAIPSVPSHATNVKLATPLKSLLGRKRSCELESGPADNARALVSDSVECMSLQFVKSGYREYCHCPLALSIAMIAIPGTESTSSSMIR